MTKKIISLVLTIAMLAGACLLLSACGDKGISEKDLQKDPVAVLDKVYANTTEAFFTDDAGIHKTMGKSIDKGSVNVTIASDELFADTGLSKLSGTVYFDTAKPAVAADALLTYEGQDLKAILFADKTGVALQSADILGGAGAYALLFESFRDLAADSPLAEMMALDEETLAEIRRAVAEISDMLSKKAEENEKELKKLEAEFLEILKQTIATEKVEIDKETTVTYLTVSYTLDMETLKALLDRLIAEMATELSPEEYQELQDTYRELWYENSPYFGLDLTEKVYIDPKTATIAKVTLAGTLSVNPNSIPTPYTDEDGKTWVADDKTEIGLDMTLTFSESEISLKAKLDADGERITASAILSKEKAEDVTTYALSIKVGASGVTIDLLDGTYVYDKKSGDIIITAKIMGGGGGVLAGLTEKPLTATVKANLAVTKDSATLKLLSADLFGEKLEPGDNDEISITVKKLKEIPAMPKDAKDITTLTKAEWEKLGEDVMNSPLAQIFGDAFGSMPPELEEEGIPVRTETVNDELTLIVPEDADEVSIDGFSAAYETDEIAVLVLREAKTDFAVYEIETLNDYAEIVAKNNGFNPDDMMDIDGVPCFEYSANGFTYLVMLWETEDAFWLINYAAPESEYDGTYACLFYDFASMLSVLND